MNKKIIYIDIDGTLCSQTDTNYKEAKPDLETIKKVNKLYDQGNTIIIYTSRYIKRSHDNPDKSKELGYNFTFNQLKFWGLKFHQLKMGKPQFDIIIDDKAYNYDKKWIKYLKY